MYSRVEARYVSRIYDTAQHLMATTWEENKKKEENEKGRKIEIQNEIVTASPYLVSYKPRVYIPTDMSNTDKFVLGIYVRMYI